MKLKYFLRGFGIGIIFAAVILTISYRISDKNEMTDGQIMKRAKELGMVMEGESDDLKKSLDDLKKSSTEKPIESTVPSQSPKPSKKPEKKTAEPEETETAKPTKEPSEEKEDNQNNQRETVKFSVQQGMSSSQIADYLESIGLVDDGDKFDDYLCNNGFSNRIVSGSFEIDGNPTYEQVAKTITRSN